MMRAASILLALLLIAGAAAAQETAEPASEPDYSREGLRRVFEVEAEREEPERPVRFGVGYIDFRALGTRWRFAYLPIMAPFVGTRQTTTSEWPDAFSLTGTSYATPPRSWRRQRTMSRELRGIERRARVTVD